ncbi:MAG: hypothetical protein AB1578_20050 [Thermodesulfobacteriota bacterium]
MTPSDVIRSVCAWCGAELGVKPARGAPGGISHGICPACVEGWRAEASLPPRTAFAALEVAT